MTKNKDSNCNNCCELFTTYIYLIWDGLGFFGHDDNKLARLKGIKPKWYDRFLNKRWLFFNLSMIIIVISVLASSYDTLGSVKS